MPGTADRFVAVRSRFSAQPAGLVELHSTFDRFFAEAELAGLGVPSSDRVALSTAAAEIAANIVDHACEDAPDGEVEVALVREPGAVEARFEDRGVRCGSAPRRPKRAPHLGVGLSIALASVDELAYSRVDGANHWLLRRRAL